VVLGSDKLQPVHMDVFCAAVTTARVKTYNCNGCTHGIYIVLFLPYSPVMPHMGHETGAGTYPSGGELSARMLMTPIPLESLFN
jgi:hypothetical protein